MATETVTFPHVRPSDNERVGYLRATEDGRFVPIDLLWNELDGPLDLDDAEARLEDLGLNYLAEDWFLDSEDHPTPVKVRIQELTPQRITVAFADFGHPADYGKSVVLPNPTGALRRTLR